MKDNYFKAMERAYGTTGDFPLEDRTFTYIGTVQSRGGICHLVLYSDTWWVHEHLTHRTVKLLIFDESLAFAGYCRFDSFPWEMRIDGCRILGSWDDGEPCIEWLSFEDGIPPKTLDRSMNLFHKSVK